MRLTRSGHRLDGGRQAAFVPSSLVLVNDSLVGNRIYGANGCLERSLRDGFVGGPNSLPHVLDRGAQLGTQTGVVVTLLNILSRTFSRLCTIGHVNSLN